MTATASSDPFVYVGTYTRRGSEGIYVYTLDMNSGALDLRHVAKDSEQPSFLALHPSGRFLYCVHEIGTFEGQPSGAVSAFAVETDGSLRRLNQKATRSPGPCHVSVDATGRLALAANYGGGSISALPILEDGSLGEATLFQHTGHSVHPQRQQAPHAHSVVPSPDNRFALAPDLGIDKVMVYALREHASSSEPASSEPASSEPASSETPPSETVTCEPAPILSADLPPGAGPRHLSFHPNHRFVYVINELDSTVAVFRYDPAQGSLEFIETQPTLPQGFEGTNHCADIHVHPSGRFLYGSNRGHDSIVIYEIEPDTGRLAVLGWQSTKGETPRNFGIDPTGTYLLAANQNSDTIVTFRIDRETGKLEDTGCVTHVPCPVCIAFLPRGEQVSMEQGSL